ncbi:MAG: DNA topoisomerase VI, partial [Methanobacteriota archaeon]
MTRGDLPSITMPTRTKKNIEYDENTEVWKYGDRERLREAGSEKSALHILKMAYVIWFIRHQIKESRSSTLRELYYISEGWNKAKFAAQNDSNLLIEDLEILTEVQREQFNLRPEEDGASIFGPLRLREETRRGSKDIHCGDDVGEAGYQ